MAGTLNADQLAQVTQRTADEGGRFNSAGELTIEMAEFACVGSVVVITIDDAGQVELSVDLVDLTSRPESWGRHGTIADGRSKRAGMAQTRRETSLVRPHVAEAVGVLRGAPQPASRSL